MSPVAPLRRRGKAGLLTGLQETVAAEVTALAGLAAGMPGSGAALGVLEEAMRAALAASGARLLEAVLAGDGMGCPARTSSAPAATRRPSPAAGPRPSPWCCDR